MLLPNTAYTYMNTCSVVLHSHRPSFSSTEITSSTLHGALFTSYEELCASKTDAFTCITQASHTWSLEKETKADSINTQGGCGNERTLDKHENNINSILRQYLSNSTT